MHLQYAPPTSDEVMGTKIQSAQKPGASGIESLHFSAVQEVL